MGNQAHEGGLEIHKEMLGSEHGGARAESADESIRRLRQAAAVPDDLGVA